MRKGKTIPYVSHLLGTAGIVLDHGGDEDQAIAALLHDAPEDQGGRARLADIRKKFGARVARIVDGCTDTFEDPKPPWLERKKAYLNHLRSAPSDVRLVSAADKLHNAREILADIRNSPRSSVWHRFRGGRQGTIWYYRALAREFRARGPKLLGAELARIVAEFPG
ncbi:MAG: HD domain-containing protein [Acidobacteria bacterium]|nr:HD domain-containing protein [Acidobacteriota bacterium]